MHDWEVKLAVVIGRSARYRASPNAALAYVAEYTISNDVSQRWLELEVRGGRGLEHQRQTIVDADNTAEPRP